MDALDRFADVVRQKDFALGDAFLAFARAENPSLDTDACLERLADLGLVARAAVVGLTDDAARLAALSRVLTAEGFHGSPDAFSDVRSSMLDQVLRRGVGIPVALSVLWCEVARRADIDLQPYGMPGRVVVGVPDSDLFVDPFESPSVLVLGELKAKYSDAESGWLDGYLDEPMRPRDVVIRALSNLKLLFGAKGNLNGLLWVEDFLLVIPGMDASEHRDRAKVLTALGRFSDAIADLEDYIGAEPSDSEIARIEIRRLISALN